MEEGTKKRAIFNLSDRVRMIAYWTFTLLVAFENAAGGMWVLLRFIPGMNQLHANFIFVEYLRVMLGHLGYPQYFQYILGPWQLACAVALVAPRLPRVKEWAYAGAFFNYSSAFVSHLFVEDAPKIVAAVYAVFTVISWALQPPDRRLAESKPVGETSALSWVASAVILAVLLILSLFWLPHVPKQ
jgi:DoxX-like protein